MPNILEIVKVSRPGFWPTHVWFYVLPFATRDMFGSFSFWVGAVYVCFPLGLLLYGWNDIGDAETDAVNQRKDSWLFGARPDQSLRKQLPTIIFLVQLPFVGLFIWLGGAKMLVWFLAMVGANAAYNTFGFKKIAVLDLLNQVGYLLVFVLSSWLCVAPHLSLPVTCFCALFAMQSHLFGQIMDVDEDRIAGRKSTAVLLGVFPSKLLLSGILFIELGIAFFCFRSWYVAAFMGAAATLFLGDAFWGPKKYPVWLTKAFFIGWNLVVVTTAYFVWRYAVFVVY